MGSPSVTDSSLDAGAWFTLSVTVENEGDGASPAATLRYYRSTDAAISTSDTEVDTDTVDKLAAPGTSSESVYLKAPTTPGTYYYGACVDAVAGESDTTNNCSTSVQVTAATLPDDCAASTSTTCAIRVSGFTSGAIENSGDRDWIRITGQPSHGASRGRPSVYIQSWRAFHHSSRSRVRRIGQPSLRRARFDRREPLHAYVGIH